MTHRSGIVFGALTGAALFLSGLAIIWLASIAGLHVSRNYNEGWNAYHALAAATGKALYPGSQSLMFNNYPPLSFYITAAVGRFLPDLVIAGRVLSLAATLGAAFALFSVARRMKTSRSEALFAASLFLAKILAASHYVGIADPQMLGHVFGCFGLVVLFGGSLQTRRLALSALFFALAFFVKHMLIVQPLAVAIWLLRTDKKTAVRFVGLGVLYAVAGYVFCRIVFGIDLIGTLMAPRAFRFSWLAQSLTDFLLVSFAPLGAGFYLLLRPANRFGSFCGIYTLLGFAIGLLFDGGAGVGRNALFDAAIAGALSAALAAHRLRAAAPLLAPVFALSCLLPPAIAGFEKVGTDFLKPQFWHSPLAKERLHSEADIAFLKNHPGPALCERLALCYWAGKAPEVDTFNFVQAVLAKTRSENALIRQFEARHFAVVEMETHPRLMELPRTMSTLLKNYRIVRRSDMGLLLIPREPGRQQARRNSMDGAHRTAKRS